MSAITPTYTFTPGDIGAGTLALTGIAGFDIRHLVRVLNLTRNVPLYDPSNALSFARVSGSTIYLKCNTSEHNAGDTLYIEYDGTETGEYETVAASQTAQSLGTTGGTGDFLSHLLIVPATTSPGAVSIKDGAGSDITVFAGGASSVSSLVPFVVPLYLYSLAGAWKITTGGNVSVIAAGNFT